MNKSSLTTTLACLAIGSLDLHAGFAPIPGFETVDALETALVYSMAELNGVIYAVDQFAYADRYWTSTDGLNFTKKTPPEGVYMLKLHGASGGLAFYQWDFLTVTTDGETFNQTDMDPDGSTEVKSVAHLGNGTWLAVMDVGLPERLFKSTDNGLSWQSFATLGGTSFDLGADSLYLIGHNGTALIYSLAGLANGADDFWRSADGGLTWQRADASFVPGLFYQHGGSTWVTGLDEGWEADIYRSDDMGLSWEKVGNLDHPDSFHSLNLQAVSKDGEFFAVGSDYKYYRSSNGTTWTAMFAPSDFGHQSYINNYFWTAGDFAYVTFNDGATASLIGGSISDTTFTVGPFSNLYAGDDGYAWSPWFGWFTHADYPYIYHYNFGWLYVVPGGEAGIYCYDFEAGWFHIDATLFPNIFSYSMPGWLYVDARTADPLYFWKLPSGEYITKADISGGEEFSFDAMFGKSYTLTDSIGTHTLIFNNPENPASDGADLVFNYKGTAYTFSNVTLAYVELVTGPQILVQAVAIQGDTAIGSQVQFTLYPDSLASGEVRYAGYSIMFGLFPELGGQGVVGTYQVDP